MQPAQLDAFLFHHRYPRLVRILPLFKLAFIITAFGFIPGGWMYGLPILAVYGYLKRAIFLAPFHRLRARLRAWRRDFSSEFGELSGALLAKHFSLCLKGFAAFIFLATMSMPGAVLAIYGLFCISDDEWQEKFSGAFEAVAHFFSGFIDGATTRVGFNKQVILGISGFISLITLAHLSGGLLLFELGLLFLQFAALYIGAKAFLKDTLTFFKHPISNVTKHLGKILGVLWGRWLAYGLFPGKVVGSMGPAFGTVQQQGIVASLVSGFLYPQGGWFIFNQGLIGLGISKMGGLFNNIVTSLFFSSNMKIWGDFHGYVGPNSFQVFAVMFVGLIIGKTIEVMADEFVNKSAMDTLRVVEGARNHLRTIARLGKNNMMSLAGQAMLVTAFMASPYAALACAYLSLSTLQLGVATTFGVQLTWSALEWGVLRWRRQVSTSTPAAPLLAPPSQQPAASEAIFHLRALPRPILVSVPSEATATSTTTTPSVLSSSPSP